MKKIILSLSLSALLFGCTEQVDVPLTDSAEKIVVEAYVCTEVDSSFVRISKTIPYFSKEKPPVVSNAVVEVFDGSQTLLFNYVGDGVYKPIAGYKADTSKQYNLKITHEGKSYESNAYLYPMFDVETELDLEFKKAEFFLEEGFAVTYWSIDRRPGDIYTVFTTWENDTAQDFRIIFGSEELVKYERRPFELPFYRAQPGDTLSLIFKSIGKVQADYIIALDQLTGGAGGPFQTPPANPPTNINGGALGYFKACDVVRVGKRIP